MNPVENYLEACPSYAAPAQPLRKALIAARSKKQRLTIFSVSRSMHNDEDSD